MAKKTKENLPTVFVPHAVKEPMKGMYIEVSHELHTRIKTGAHAHGVSMKNFMIQALEFALASMSEAETD